MDIKFLAHGTGSARAAVDYLLGERDHAGRVRERVQVLVGDPAQVAAAADALGTVHHYSSAVIAFHPDDQPSDADIAGVLGDFQELAFAGLPDDGYAWTAVQHGHTGRPGVHVHVLVARVELHSGLAFNPAPPNWRKHFDHVRDAWNIERGWVRPDDRSRARLVQPAPHDLYRRSAQRRAGQAPVPDARTAVTDWLVGQVEIGRVTDRATLLAALAEHFEVTRAGRDYVSVRLAPDTKPIRLKGALYDQHFTTDTITHRGQAVADRGGRADRHHAASTPDAAQTSSTGVADLNDGSGSRHANPGHDGRVDGAGGRGDSGATRPDRGGGGLGAAGAGEPAAGPGVGPREQLRQAVQRRAAFNQVKYRDRTGGHRAGEPGNPAPRPAGDDLAADRLPARLHADRPGRDVDRAAPGRGTAGHHDDHPQRQDHVGADPVRVDDLQLGGQQQPCRRINQSK